MTPQVGISEIILSFQEEKFNFILVKFIYLYQQPFNVAYFNSVIKIASIMCYDVKIKIQGKICINEAGVIHVLCSFWQACENNTLVITISEVGCRIIPITHDPGIFFTMSATAKSARK